MDGADVSIDTIDLMQDDEAVGGPPESIVVRTEAHAAFSPPFFVVGRCIHNSSSFKSGELAFLVSNFERLRRSKLAILESQKAKRILL